MHGYGRAGCTMDMVLADPNKVEIDYWASAKK
jgi:hypothetical protein